MPNGSETLPERPQQPSPEEAQVLRIMKEKYGQDWTVEQLEAVKELLFPGVREEVEGMRRSRYDVRPQDSGPLVKGELHKRFEDIIKVGKIKSADMWNAIKTGLTELEDLDRKTINNNPGLADETLKRFINVVDNQRRIAQDANDLEPLGELDRLVNAAEEYRRHVNIGIGGEELGAVTFSLTGDETKRITNSLAGAREVFETWISEIESRDKFAHQDVNQGLFSKYQSAVSWFATLDYPNEGDSEEVRRRKNEIINEFKARIELHNMKQAMASNDEQTIVHESVNIGSATMFEGFRVAKAEVAFNLYQRYFERYRFRYGKLQKVWDEEKREFVDREEKVSGVALDRITQTHLNTIQNKVQEELTTNYHLYGFKDKKEAYTAAKVGFNVFRASMRMAVHVSKGRVLRAEMLSEKGYRELRKEDTFESDPDEILVNQYNPWQFGIEKWNKMGKPKYKMFENIMKLMGKEDLEVGHQKMINALAIPDYFSSSWRIKTVFEALEKRLFIAQREANPGKTEEDVKSIVEDQIASIATGLKFKLNGRHKDKNKAKDAARNVAKYRPLEFIKAYAVDYDELGNAYSSGARQDEFKRMLDRGEFDTGNIEIRNYVRLEEILGRYIYPIYEKAMNPVKRDKKGKVILDHDGNPAFDWINLKGIDIANPTGEHEGYITGVVELINENVPPEKQLTVFQLKALYKKIQDFASNNATLDDINKTPRHDHMHHKTLYLDDAPLGQMEQVMINSDGDDLPKVSKQFFETEGGRRDPYARMWGDTFTATAAQNHMWEAMDARDHGKLTEALAGVAGTLINYSGREPYMYLSANIAAGWLDLAKAENVWGTFSLNDKVPWATSEFERLFGLAAPSMSRDEVKGAWERIKLGLGQYKFEGETEADIEKRMTKELGLETYKLAITTLKSLALIVLILMMQTIMKEQENIDEA